MTTYFHFAAVALGLLLAFPLVRIIRGPTVFDRLLGAAMMGTKTMTILVLMGAAIDRLDMFVDVSLGYGLALVVGTLITTKYFESEARS